MNVILEVESGNTDIPVHIDASLQRPRKWLRLTVDTVDQFISGFINEILHNIEQHPVQGDYGHQKIIIWDNLHANKTPYVTNFIEDREYPNTLLPSIDFLTVPILCLLSLYIANWQQN